jgi:hypothetical protein
MAEPKDPSFLEADVYEYYEHALISSLEDLKASRGSLFSMWHKRSLPFMYGAFYHIRSLLTSILVVSRYLVHILFYH